MSVHAIRVKLYSENAEFIRTEWGKTRRQAMKTLWGIYGDNIEYLI